MSERTRRCIKCGGWISGPAVAVDPDPESPRSFRFEHRTCHTPALGAVRRTRRGTLVKRVGGAGTGYRPFDPLHPGIAS